MTRPINCRGARAVCRIERFPFRMQGRITTWKMNLCAKRVQCSGGNTEQARAKSIECSGWNIEHSWQSAEEGESLLEGLRKGVLCSGWNIVLNVPVGTQRRNVPTGTLCKVFRLEHW